MLVSNCSAIYVSTTFIYRHIFLKDVNIYDTSFVTITTYDRKCYQAKKLKVHKYTIWMAQYWHLDCEWQYLQPQPLGTSPSHSWNETISSFHKDWGSSITDPFELGLGGGSPWSKPCPQGPHPIPPNLVNPEALETSDLTCALCLQIIMPHSKHHSAFLACLFWGLFGMLRGSPCCWTRCRPEGGCRSGHFL